MENCESTKNYFSTKKVKINFTVRTTRLLWTTGADGCKKTEG